MSNKISVSSIDQASMAFDTITEQYVDICEQIGDSNFYICQSTVDEKYLICNKDYLEDFHYYGERW